MVREEHTVRPNKPRSSTSARIETAMGEKGNVPSGVTASSGSKNPMSTPATKVPGGYSGHPAAKFPDDSWAKDQAGYPGDPMGKIGTDAAAKLTPPPAGWPPPPPPPAGPPAAPPPGPLPIPPYIGGVVHRRDDRDDPPQEWPPASGPGS